MAALNFNHLRYFWAVAHEQGLTRAAERLNVSPSALSVQIQKLEHQLGQSLFDRVGKRLVLTEAGRIALAYADEVFEAGDELLSTFAGRPHGGRPILRVGALATLSRNFQLEFLRPLVERAEVELIVRSGALRDLLDQLTAHSLDVILSNGPPPAEFRDSVRAQLLDQQPVSLVGRPGSTEDSFVFPGSLSTVPLLLPSPESEIRIRFDRILERANVRPIILAEVDDMAMLRLLAREGHGLALAPSIVVRDELESGLLVEFARVEQLEERFYALTAMRRFPNPSLATLLGVAVPGTVAAPTPNAVGRLGQ